MVSMALAGKFLSNILVKCYNFAFRYTFAFADYSERRRALTSKVKTVVLQITCQTETLCEPSG